MRAVTFFKLLYKIKDYFDSMTNSSDVLIVPRNGDDESVVIMSLEEYNSLRETNYLLSAKTNRERLLESIEQSEVGDFQEIEMDELLNRCE